ncbi:MAG TPA: TonB family protein [Candidatus Saccharimonadales bacterium]|jgi:TonB family protein|nr:TonB family protein [Candidatus Saccharimonadales bacterium]
MATQPSDTSKRTTQRTLADELAVIAQRAQAFTNASGAAIALSEGAADEIVCKARSGASAPEIGAALSVEGSFTGVCIQSGRELRCDDTETDTRVDTGAVRRLGIRSMVITPVKEDNKPIGVLAVFASTPHAFTITHVAVLKTMADQISGLLQKERRMRDEGLRETPDPMTRMPVASTPMPVPGPVAVKPPVPVPIPVPAPITVRPVVPVAARVEPIRPVALAEDVAAPMAIPKREERRPELKEEAVLKSGLGTFDSMAERPRSGNMLPIYGLLALVLAGSAGTWFYLRARRANTASSQAASRPTVTAPVASDANAAANNGATPAASTPAASYTSSAAAPVTQPPAPVASAKALPEKTDTSRRTAPTSAPAPAAVALSSGPSKINTAKAPQANSGPDIAPNLAVGNSGSSALSNLARPGNSVAPSASIQQSELVDVQLLRTVQPVYPGIARARRVTGQVRVKLRISKEGKVISAQFFSGPEIFKDAALEAVKQWQYKPATLDGKAIEQETEAKLNFKP